MKKITTILLLTLLIAPNLWAQTPFDFQMMGKGEACVFAQYSHTSWKEYWEGKLLRENLNLGTVSTQSYTVTAVAGIGKNTNLFVSLPFVKTQASAGQLMGQSGIQDLSAMVKLRLVNKPNGFKMLALIGGTAPIGNYVPDFMPMSIGMQSKTFTARIIAAYKTNIGLYVNGSADYTVRSKIKIDKDAYQYDGKIYNTNVVPVPNSTAVTAHLGYLNPSFQIEANFVRNVCVSGDDIRRNDMPFPTNGMFNTNIGGFVKYQPKHIGIQVAYSQVLDGRNFGKGSTYSAGIVYRFAYNKPSNPIVK